MKTIATLLTALVALLHIGFLALEMFFWDHPVGRKIFNMTEQASADTAVLAANQGLYNGFLAAGLIWGLIAKKRDVVIFFLLCVIIAGIFGAVTAKPTILFTQALPALLALGFTWLAKRQSLK
jgi:putative membrane protein